MNELLRKVDVRIKKIIEEEFCSSNQSESIRQFQKYLFESQGKMRRTFLMGILMSGLGKEDERSVEIAAIGEIIHLASLLHDDVIDHAHLRRNKSAYHIHHGNKNAILFGDLLLAVALEKLGKLTDSDFLLPLFIDSVKGLALGEILQSEWKGKLSLPEDVYEKIIVGKTGALFSAFSTSAAFLALGSKKRSLPYGVFGRRFGRFYQLRDDTLDFVSMNSAKDQKNDFENKNLTYPLLLLRQKVSTEEYRMLQDSWGNTDKYEYVFDLFSKYQIYPQIRLVLGQELKDLTKFLAEELKASTFTAVEKYFNKLSLPEMITSLPE